MDEEGREEDAVRTRKRNWVEKNMMVERERNKRVIE